mmetsp:Transcript_1703/g.2244  ORF Transcript_1703/g.2244 Transcript_1703/m.2244 type:complete len:263 (+) Transcript_1703:78-866(+)
MASYSDYKKEPLPSDQLKLIRVIAPTNLPGLYQMEVTTDTEPAINFMATVPAEGVKRGDVFLTPPPPDYTPASPQINAPIGRWKDGLCDFFNYGLCHSHAWMALCCTELAMGQVMQRMRLTWFGGLVADNTPVNVFRTVFCLVFSYFVYDTALSLYLSYNVEPGQNIEDLSTAALIVYIMREIGVVLFAIWSIYALYKTRQNVRRTFSIPEERCIGCEDCMCSLCCACCTVAQIARHTGEFEKYPSVCFTEDGLPDGSPSAV